jgi:hypothetical protein
MGAASSAHGGDEKCVQKFGWKSWGEGTTLRLRRRWKDNIKMWFGGVDLIHLAQDRDGWLAFVNTIMNLRVP